MPEARKNAEFDYGDAVRVKLSAPPDKRPGQLCSICGFREIVRPGLASLSSPGHNVTLVLVEFPGGESIEIEEDLLEKF